MLTEYVVDPEEVPWKRSDFEGVAFVGQVLLKGDDGGPEAFRFQFSPTLSMYAHMHLTAQFQLLLGGTMDLPKPSMKLRPIAIHYTDHNVPYGPFSVSGSHEALVLHPRQSGIMTMANRTARKEINLAGRELSGMEKDRESVPIPGREEISCKVLIPAMLGPEVAILECPPNTAVALGPPTYGRYEVVARGSASVKGRLLGPPGLRYVIGDEPPEPFVTGPEGGTVLFLSFDKDALEGGLTGEGIALEAEEAMAKAI